MDIRKKSLEVFCCYARKDQPLLKELKNHLIPLEREGLITLWADTDINAGAEWAKEIHLHLNTSHIILLLVSPDFIASEYCYSVEMQRAIERHTSGEARVIPIILRPISWQRMPFGKLQALPTSADPITSRRWQDQDEAFYDIAEGIREVVAEQARLSEGKLPQRSPSSLSAQLDMPAAPLAQTIQMVTDPLQPGPLGQEEGVEELDTRAVWERVKRKDVPSTWYVLDESLIQTIKMAFFAAFLWGGAMCVIFILIVGILAALPGVASPFHNTLGQIIEYTIEACIVGGALFGFTLAPFCRNRLVLMPDGFIRFYAGGHPSYIISYKEVEDIRFDSIKKNLVVTTSWSGTPKDDRMNPALRSGAVAIHGFNEVPHLIAQRVERAYTSFKARNPLP